MTQTVRAMPKYSVADRSGTHIVVHADNRKEAARAYVMGGEWNGATEIEVTVYEVDAEGLHSPTHHSVKVADAHLAD